MAALRYPELTLNKGRSKTRRDRHEDCSCWRSNRGSFRRGGDWRFGSAPELLKIEQLLALANFLFHKKN